MCSLSQSADHLGPSLAVNDLNLLSFLYAIMSINQFTCAPSGMFQVFFEHSTTFPVCSCPCYNFFWSVLLGINSERVLISTKTIKFVNLSVKYHIFVPYSVDYELKRICKSFFFFLFILYILPNLFGIGVSKCFTGAGTGSKFHN